MSEQGTTGPIPIEQVMRTLAGRHPTVYDSDREVVSCLEEGAFEIERLKAELHQCEATNTALRERVAELEAALEKLARLGNGDNYGNSDGNMIAREALAASKKGYDHYNAAPRSLADGPHDHDHLENA